MQQRLIIVEVSTVAGLAATRLGMTLGGSIIGGITGTTTTTTMPLRAGRV